ncbi:hypothetical protein [Paenibacillus sp. GXUN7292]|uniref:hypothetical protein n=1 Tax=Paenibacillus sp. GXUN7292 TaxID=3422499 RepID=UPI003D7D0D61
MYGLLNGMETIVDEEISRIGFISNEKFSAMCKILDGYFYDQTNLDKFRGFYDIESELNSVGVDRSEAIRILTYLKANGSYEELIDKMNSQYSPVECKRFKVSELDS